MSNYQIVIVGPAPDFDIAHVFWDNIEDVLETVKISLSRNYTVISIYRRVKLFDRKEVID